MNILFWNTHKNTYKENIDSCLIELIIENNCDIVLLAEYIDELNDLCFRLNVKSKESYTILPNNKGCDHIKGLIKKKYFIGSLVETSRYQISKLETSSYKMIIGAIHNHSKPHSSEDKQRIELTALHHDIRQQEREHNTKNSVIIGDLNINPFDKICVEADSLFAIPYKNEMKETTAIRGGREYEKFYNPSWKFLESSTMPYTSYRYDTCDLVDYYWNMFDQVIIRPQLIKAFDYENFRILTETQHHKLILNEKPNINNYSDHLPIFCKFKEEKIK